MIANRYKSWNNLKKQMNGLLCGSLKDKITYFCTSYHEVHNSYGRATINYNKKELVSFSWIEMYEQDYDEEQNEEKWMKDGTLSNIDFLNAVTIYLNTGIKESLESDNYLLRVFAYLDKRVGKRTLIKIKDEVELLPNWVKQFYNIRCKEENL